MVEALACGKLVLIPNKVNIWREIEADASGLVEADTSTGATAAIKRWLNALPPGRAATASHARQTFEKRFTVTACASASALLRAVSA